MGFFDSFIPHEESSKHYEDVYYTEQVQPHHESSWTHEAVAGAAGFAAMKAYESHLRATGQNPSHETMKEILAAIAAAEVDKLAETKGLDWIDRRKAQEMAKHQAHQLAREKYGEGGNGYEAAQREAGYAPAYEYNFNGGAPYGAPGCPSYGQGGYGGPPGGGYGGPPGGGYGGPPGGGYGGPPRGEYGGGYGGPQGGYGGPPPGGPPHHHGHRFEGPPSERYDGPPPGQGYGGGYEQGPPQGYYNQQGGGYNQGY